MAKLDEDYLVRLQDPFAWINVAKKHLIAAKCIEKRINEIISIDPDVDDEAISFEFQALMNSCLFLVGIGLENAIKGYLIAQNPNIKSIAELNNSTSGHKITDMYRASCNHIYVSNKPYLERIQEYLIWIGKYSIPTESKFLLPSTEYTNADVRIATRIIDEVEKMIINLPLRNTHNKA